MLLTGSMRMLMSASGEEAAFALPVRFAFLFVDMDDPPDWSGSGRGGAARYAPGNRPDAAALTEAGRRGAAPEAATSPAGRAGHTGCAAHNMDCRRRDGAWKGKDAPDRGGRTSRAIPPRPGAARHPWTGAP